ncbi:MAG TPA: YicC/YloC family endoribonuclease [Candidatus Binatia bacterium]
MTGYGAASGHAGTCRISVEVRSVNQRFLDLKLNVPREYGPYEPDLRRIVSSAIERGRVEVHVSRTLPPRSAGIALQKDVASAYIKGWKQLQKEFGLSGSLELSLLAGRSDLFVAVEPAADAAAEIGEVEKLLGKALAAHAKEREREGAHLRKDMQERIKRLRATWKALEKAAARVAPRLKAKLDKRLAELLGGATVDPGRLVQETAILADRCDVNEELVRLASHLGALDELVRSEQPVAKRIDFVLQEVNRELNTIGSKASDLTVTNLVVDGKADVEKLREQIQNVE